MSSFDRRSSLLASHYNGGSRTWVTTDFLKWTGGAGTMNVGFLRND